MMKTFIAAYLLLFAVVVYMTVTAIVTDRTELWTFAIMASIPLVLLGSIYIAMKLLKVDIF